MKLVTMFLVVVFAIILYPILNFVRVSNLFLSNKHYHDEQCRVIHKDDFEGLEDITMIYNDNDVTDFIGSVDARRQTWLDPLHQMGQGFAEGGVEPSSQSQSGLVLIRVLKKQCTSSEAIDECITVTAVDAPLTDKTVLFQPHGVFFDKSAQLLYVISHAFHLGGDRVELFSVKRSAPLLKKQKDDKKKPSSAPSGGGNAAPSSPQIVTVTHMRSITWAAGSWPPAEFNALPHTSQGVAPRGSAYGVMNDITLDKVNNRLLVTQWKPFPLGRKFPRKKYIRDELYPMLLTLFANPTMVLSCPNAATAEVEPDNRQCVRSTQRYTLANGIISNKKGDVVALFDVADVALHFISPDKMKKSDDDDDQQELPTLTTLGKYKTQYAADNVELHSDNSTHVCYTLGLIQRIIESVNVNHNRFASTSGGASLVCCPYTSSGAGRRSLATDKCQEEILFLGDGANGKTQSGISVAVMMDAPWAGRKEQRLVLTGSWYDNGIGVCWV